MNVVRPWKKLEILHLLVEGNSIRSVERLTRTHRDTIIKILVGVGQKCRSFLDQRMRNLRREHWEVDEMWTFCRKKERRLTDEEKAEGVWGDQYLFLAIGQESKLVPTFVLGRRDEANARCFMKDLAGRLAKGRNRLSTDGFIPYPEAVRGAFKDGADYGVLVKEYTATTVRISRRVVCGAFPEEDICTSHVERNNLTIRTLMRRYVRRTLGFSKKMENLETAVALHLAHYNFCWKHSALDMTPAMAAGLESRRWRLDDLMERAGVLNLWG